MTKKRHEIEAALADRGRPAMWANEKEAAALSGVGPEVFRGKVKGWESRGFPKINAENGKRSIPGILAFWGLPLGPTPTLTTAATPPAEDDDEDGTINFGGRECWPSATSPTGYVDQHGKPVSQPGRWGATSKEIYGKPPRRPKGR